MKNPKTPTPSGVEKFDNFEDLKKSEDKIISSQSDSDEKVQDFIKLLRQNITAEKASATIVKTIQ